MRLAFCIPSIGRKVLEKAVKRIVEYSDYDNLFVITDDSNEKDISERGLESIIGENDELVVIETEKGYTGAGNARKIAVDYVLKNTDIDYIFNVDDNAFVKSRDTINNILKAMKADNRIGYCGAIGNYTIWYRDFDEYSARFFTNLGVFYCIKREVFEKAGNFDSFLECREDVEMGIKTWKAGYWVLAVWAPIEHTSSDTFDNSSDRWMRMCEYIAEKHKGDVIATKNGQIRRRNIDYPELDIGFNKDYEFYAKEKEE